VLLSFLAPHQAAGSAEPPPPPAILRRKPTRIELKPDDREEYFAHKNKETEKESKQQDTKQSDKDTRIGIVRPR